MNAFLSMCPYQLQSSTNIPFFYNSKQISSDAEMETEMTVTNKNNKVYTLVSFIRGINEFKTINSSSGASTNVDATHFEAYSKIDNTNWIKFDSGNTKKIKFENINFITSKGKVKLYLLFYLQNDYIRNFNEKRVQQEKKQKIQNSINNKLVLFI